MSSKLTDETPSRHFPDIRRDPQPVARCISIKLAEICRHLYQTLVPSIEGGDYRRKPVNRRVAAPCCHSLSGFATHLDPEPRHPFLRDGQCHRAWTFAADQCVTKEIRSLLQHETCAVWPEEHLVGNRGHRDFPLPQVGSLGQPRISEQKCRYRPLHVAGAETEKPVLLLGQGEWFDSPVIPWSNGDRIHMTVEDEMPSGAVCDRRHEIRLVLRTL